MTENDTMTDADFVAAYIARAEAMSDEETTDRKREFLLVGSMLDDARLNDLTSDMSKAAALALHTKAMTLAVDAVTAGEFRDPAKLVVEAINRVRGLVPLVPGGEA